MLHAVVDRLCALSGVSKPKLKVIEVRWANAVAFRLPGRRPTIAVTRGLLCSSTALGAESGLGQPFEPRFRRSRRHRRKRHPDHAHDRDGCGQASVDTSRLEAVLAHELAHIAHRDASVMPFVTALVMWPNSLGILPLRLAVFLVGPLDRVDNLICPGSRNGVIWTGSRCNRTTIRCRCRRRHR